MKIQIEFNSTLEAKLTIDGKKMKVVSRPGSVRLEGIKGPMLEDTLGGVIASHLFDTVSNIQQAWASAEEECPDLKTWEVITEEAIEAAEERLW